MEAPSLERLIRVIPDWPTRGVMFQDLTGVLASATGLAEVSAALAAPFRGAQVDVVAGMEARGFIVGTAVARELGTGFVALRKAGKLPGEVHSTSYDLEYGSATLQVHKEDIPAGSRVLLIDDVLATGGTAKAAAELIAMASAHVVGLGVILSLEFLEGRSKLDGVTIHALRNIT